MATDNRQLNLIYVHRMSVVSAHLELGSVAAWVTTSFSWRDTQRYEVLLFCLNAWSIDCGRTRRINLSNFLVLDWSQQRWFPRVGFSLLKCRSITRIYGYWELFPCLCSPCAPWSWNYYVQALLTAGVDSFEKLAAADPRRLETLTGRRYPFGDQLKASLDDLPPKVDMMLSESDHGQDQCILTLTRASGSRLSTKRFHLAELVSFQTEFICNNWFEWSQNARITLLKESSR